MKRKQITVEEHVAQFADEPVEKRARWATLFNTQAKADTTRNLLASFYGTRPRNVADEELGKYGDALERDDLHRFVDAINANDRHALHGLAGLFLMHPIDPEFWKMRAQECIDFYERLYNARPNRTNAKLLEDEKRFYGPQALGASSARILKKQAKAKE